MRVTRHGYAGVACKALKEGFLRKPRGKLPAAVPLQVQQADEA